MTREELKQKRISAISLGCDKNKVDLENMLGRLKKYGFEIVSDPQLANIVIVNTCSFIQPAKEEAIANILEMINLKNNGVIEKLIVTGCFPERYYEDGLRSFPEVDKFLKIKENINICGEIETIYGLPAGKPDNKFSRILTSGSTYAYLKIADGCSNVCSYCAIPRIRGRYISQPMDELVDEAKQLAEMGVKELIIVAQDTTRYGEDLYGENKLLQLLEKISKIKEIKWIRLHYAYPEKVDKNLLDYIVANPKMCKYIDIPLQHIDNDILSSMRRKSDENATRQLAKMLKSYDIKVRSTYIVGYPGEGKAQFKKLCDFIKESQFDYVGFFPYFKEENTASFYMSKHVKQLIKNRRLKKIKKLQNGISLAKAKSEIGKEITVLVDRFDENCGEYICHSENQSPSVDFGVRIVDNNCVRIGDFVKVKIYDFDGNDFKGEIV